MKKLMVCLVAFSLIGCVEKHFTGNIKIESRDGQTSSISIQFPSDTTVNNKEEAERLEQLLESFLETIHTAKERAFEAPKK